MKSIPNKINAISNEIKNISFRNNINKINIKNQLNLQNNISSNIILFQETVTANDNGTYYYTWNFDLGNISFNDIYNLKATVLSSIDTLTDSIIQQIFSIDDNEKSEQKTYFNVIFSAKKPNPAIIPKLTIIVFKQTNRMSLININAIPIDYINITGA